MSIHLDYVLVLSAVASVLVAVPGTGARLPLVRDGKPACEIAAVCPGGPDALIVRSANEIAGTVSRWSGAVARPSVVSGDRLPSGPGIVLATLDSLRQVVPDAETACPELARVAFVDPQGYACAFVGDKIYVVARSPRGVYNGAVYLCDFAIDGPREALSIDLEPTVRTPQMGGRATYTLNIWGREAKYTVGHWKLAFDRFARDGMDRNYFWISGHFPSRKYPQTYRCKDGEYDSTVDSGIGTLDDLRELIRYSHELGTAIYLGGGLGGWVGTGLLTNKRPGTMKQGEGIASYSLCPSNPESRKALIEYYCEMFAALPEADGLYIEMADEWGECVCPLCHKAVDDFGSRQYGQSQITLIQEIARGVWRSHPHARIAITVGYAEHKSDPAYYEVLRQMNDPRFELMEARESWAFAGPGGKEMPGTFLSGHLMHWSQYYAHSLEKLVSDANKVAQAGWYGLITAYEPGAGTGSFYTQIPFDPDILPYALTGFVYREVTWQPTMSLGETKALVQRRFFGAEAPAGLADDLWNLREMIRGLAGAEKLSTERAADLDRIARNADAARPNASPKTLEGLDLIDRAVRDIREHFRAK